VGNEAFQKVILGGFKEEVAENLCGACGIFLMKASMSINNV
jgi:hypothetical protein